MKKAVACLSMPKADDNNAPGGMPWGLQDQVAY